MDKYYYIETPQDNPDGYIYTHYGHYHKDHKPRLKGYYMVLDDHIIASVDKVKKKFEQDIDKKIKEFDKSIKDMIAKNDKKVASMVKILNDLDEFIKHISVSYGYIRDKVSKQSYNSINDIEPKSKKINTSKNDK